jgi:ElaB/YqjD/DUF883 family membrane-anchored ribosome-binding protein
MDEANVEGKPTPGQRLDHAIDTTRGTVEKVRDDVKKRIEKGTEDLRHRLDRGKEVVSEYRTKGKETWDEIRGKDVDELITSAREFAKEHPGTTLLGGMVLGFLLGAILRRRD